ncbi:hypothetical protein FQA39_LY02257 [Lamprigera yunnana]|nr:hypothetical protein FQA39_LY02257 [Lamprigera yunnana]
MLCFSYILPSMKMYFLNRKAKNVLKIWNPCEITNQQLCKSSYVVMVLNRPIPSTIPKHFIINLWNKALLRVTVDGGTNQWLSWIKWNYCEEEVTNTPDLITGDMDSVSKESLDYFTRRNKSLKIIETPDQNETDFTKALREVHSYSTCNQVQIDNIVVVVDSSGRFDQILANIQTLFKADEIVPNINVILLGDRSLTWLLKGNTTHTIKIPKGAIAKQRWCALIPIGYPCIVTTTGLKWNLTNGLLKFGNIVSTSNTYNGDPCVTIVSNNSIIWSMSVEDAL